MTYRAKVIAGGKIVIPAQLRREMGIKDGDSLVVARDSAGGLSVRTFDQVVRDVQAQVSAMTKIGQMQGAVEELLADRRADAALAEARLPIGRGA